MRTFAVAPGRTDVAVGSLVLESFDNHLAPTFVALTAELAGARAGEPAAEETMQSQVMPQVLIFGGGSSHDFARWFAQEDVETLAALGKVVAYSDQPAELGRALDTLEVLVLCNNQPLADGALRANMYGTARVAVGGDRDVLVVPSSAVQRAKSVEVVFVQLAPDEYETRRVKVVRRQGEVALSGVDDVGEARALGLKLGAEVRAEGGDAILLPE